VGRWLVSSVDQAEPDEYPTERLPHSIGESNPVPNAELPRACSFIGTDARGRLPSRAIRRYSASWLRTSGPSFRPLHQRFDCSGHADLRRRAAS